MKDFPTNILSQKGFVSAAGYDDESDKQESDRDKGAQNNQIVREAGAQETSHKDTGAQQTTKNMSADAQNVGKKDVNTS